MQTVSAVTGLFGFVVGLILRCFSVRINLSFSIYHAVTITHYSCHLLFVFESHSGPFQRHDSKEESRAKHQQRKQQRARSRPHSERKWSRSGRNTDRHMADVKIELGPMPFDPKY